MYTTRSFSWRLTWCRRPTRAILGCQWGRRPWRMHSGIDRSSSTRTILIGQTATALFFTRPRMRVALCSASRHRIRPALDELKRCRQWGSRTPGHPEYGKTPGVEATTGPLGQGLANGVGMAIAEMALGARFNRPGHQIVDHFTYVLVSDGDLEEGISWRPDRSQATSILESSSFFTQITTSPSREAQN